MSETETVPSETGTEAVDIGALDLSDLDMGLVDAKFEEPSRGAAVTPGYYKLQFPETITGKSFEYTDKQTGELRKAARFTLDPLTIAEGEIGAGRFVKSGNGRQAELNTFTHYGQSTSNIWDLMIGEGQATTDAPPTGDQIKAFLDYMQGRVTTQAIRLEPTGYYKGAAAETVADGVNTDGTLINPRPAGKTCRQPSEAGYVDVYASAFGYGSKFTSPITVVDVNGVQHTVEARPKVADSAKTRGWLGKRG